MWLNNMVTDGFGKLENNSCMFNQLIVPITHTVWAINYFLPVSDIKNAKLSQLPHNVGTPRFLSILVADLGERTCLATARGHNTQIAEIVLFV